MLDSRGYAKLTDFGLAAQMTLGKRRFSFCGTPDMVRNFENFIF